MEMPLNQLAAPSRLKSGLEPQATPNILAKLAMLPAQEVPW